MSVMIIPEAWPSLYLFPKELECPMRKEVRISMLKASDFSESSSFIESYLLSTAHAIESIALSIIMIIGYVGTAFYHFFVTLIDEDFFKALAYLGEDLLASLQSLALSIIGVSTLAAGILYPKIYTFLRPREEQILSWIELKDQGTETNPPPRPLPPPNLQAGMANDLLRLKAIKEVEKTASEIASDTISQFANSSIMRSSSIDGPESTRLPSTLFSTPLADTSRTNVLGEVKRLSQTFAESIVSNFVPAFIQEIPQRNAIPEVQKTASSVAEEIIEEPTNMTLRVSLSELDPPHPLPPPPDLHAFSEHAVNQYLQAGIANHLRRLEAIKEVQKIPSSFAEEIMEETTSVTLRSSLSELDPPVLFQLEEEENEGSECAFSIVDENECKMSTTTEVSSQYFAAEQLTDSILRPLTAPDASLDHDILQMMATFPHLFERSVALSSLGKVLSFTTPLEDRSRHVFQDRALLDLFYQIDSRLEKMEGKAKVFVQKIITDLTLFTAFVPSLLKAGNYRSIDPFSIKNIETFINHILEGRELGSTTFFNAYFEKAKSAPQRLLFLSLLHLRFDIQEGVLEDPLFQTILEHPHLEEIMLSSSGHLIQTSLYSCVGAAYNAQVLHKTPNIIALIHFTEYVLTRSEKRLEAMTEEEKGEVAFERYHLSKEAHAKEVAGKVKREIEMMRSSLEKALDSDPFSITPFEEFTKGWNDLNQRAMTVLYPKNPVWFAALPIHGHYRTSYTLNVLGHLFSPWGPGFSERRSHGQFRKDLLERIPVVDGLEDQVFDNNLNRYKTKEAKLEELQIRFEKLLRHGSLFLLTEIGPETKHANTIRAFYYQGAPHFMLFDPMKPYPRLMTFEKMLEFCG